jgi:hypothetical protein
MQTFLAIVGQMAQIAPTVMDKVNTDIVVDKMGKIYSIDPELIRDGDQVQEIRMQRQQREAQMAKMQMMAATAGTMKDAGDATRKFADAEQKRAATR